MKLVVPRPPARPASRFPAPRPTAPKTTLALAPTRPCPCPTRPFSPCKCFTVQYNTIQYTKIQYNAIHYNTIQYMYNTILFFFFLTLTTSVPKRTKVAIRTFVNCFEQGAGPIRCCVTIATVQGCGLTAEWQMGLAVGT